MSEQYKEGKWSGGEKIYLQGGPGEAVPLGLIRWVLDQQRYDARFLANANKAAAKADGEPTWTNATWLVKLEKDGTPGAFLRAKDLGLSEKDLFVVLKDGKPLAVDPYDEASAVEGGLFVTTELAGIQVKSGVQPLP